MPNPKAQLILEHFSFYIFLLHTIMRPYELSGFISPWPSGGQASPTTPKCTLLIWFDHPNPRQAPRLNPINPCVIVTTVFLIPKVSRDTETRRWWMDFSTQEMTAEETPYPLSSPSSFFTLLPPAMVTEPYLGLAACSCQISVKAPGLFLSFPVSPRDVGWPALWMGCVQGSHSFTGRIFCWLMQIIVKWPIQSPHLAISIFELGMAKQETVQQALQTPCL